MHHQKKSSPQHQVFERFYQKPWIECDWAERKLRTKRLQHAILYMVESYIQHKYVDWDKAGEIFEPSNPTPGLAMKRTFKNKKIAGAHDALLLARLQELGLTDEFAAAAIKKAVEIAEEKRDAANLIKAAAEVNRMRGAYVQRAVMETEETSDSPLPTSIMAEYYNLEEQKPPVQLPEHTTQEAEHGTDNDNN